MNKPILVIIYLVFKFFEEHSPKYLLNYKKNLSTILEKKK